MNTVIQLIFLSKKPISAPLRTARSKSVFLIGQTALDSMHSLDTAVCISEESLKKVVTN